jgi:hypothetical protein
MDRQSIWQRDWVQQHTQRLLASFSHWTGQPLLDTTFALAQADASSAIAQALFMAPFVVVSHGTEPDPVLNYGNQQALDLWEMDWDQLTQTPSRQTAEPIEQTERAALLQQAKANGYIRDYQGIRISSRGRRFWIRDVIVWDVLDEKGQRCGQAATFDRWEWLEAINPDG